MKTINLKTIRIDGGTQSRVALNESTVAEYAEAIAEGVKLPPVTVFFDGSDNWLADGFHRFHAYNRAGKASIHADIREGTVREAILYSFGANCTHGLRRTNADKRKAVSAMLADDEWSAWSDRKIAEACGVSQPFVSGMRKPEKVITVITPKASKVESDSTPASAQVSAGVVTVTTPDEMKAARKVEFAPAAKAGMSSDDEPLTDADELAEAHHTITELAQENERLQDRLAVEAMDASEEEKLAASETISELRARVVTLEAEVEALKVSRDTYMREAGEAKKSAIYWRKQAEKARTAA
jgi:hypothetical protein